MFFADTVSNLNLAPLEVPAWEILVRLVGSMLMGAIVGLEREFTHRPAGMRTHMLVSLGSCAIMVISQLLFVQYRPFGAVPDPARLSAQVVTGVGFLGAGTIMREGPTVKGLTTAASLWAVACLGIAIGGGMYLVAIVGIVCVLLTLTIFEWFQKRILDSHNVLQDFTLSCRDVGAALAQINMLATANRTILSNIQVEKRPEDHYQISFRAEFDGPKSTTRKDRFLEGLVSFPDITSVNVLGEYHVNSPKKKEKTTKV